MSLSSRMVAVLTAVGLFSGSFLAIVGQMTKERILLNKRHAIEQAALRVVPGAHSIAMVHESAELTIFAEKDEQGALVGYALQASGTGFQDKIALCVGVNPEFTQILALTIIDQKETPGLGAKIQDNNSFLRFWHNRDCSRPLALRKPPVADIAALAPNEVNTITGATISSTAVVNIVNAALNKARQVKAEGKFAEGK